MNARCQALSVGVSNKRTSSPGTNGLKNDAKCLDLHLDSRKLVMDSCDAIQKAHTVQRHIGSTSEERLTCGFRLQAEDPVSSIPKREAHDGCDFST